MKKQPLTTRECSRDVSYAHPIKIKYSKLQYSDDINENSLIAMLNGHFESIYRSVSISENIEVLDNIIEQLKPTNTIQNLNQTIPRQPLLSLGKPPGRFECHLLSKWMDVKLLNEKDPNTRKLIYEFSFLELIRQVSVQCIEWGSLFKSILKGLKTSYEKQLQNFSYKAISEQADMRIILSKQLEDINTLKAVIDQHHKNEMEYSKKIFSATKERDYFKEEVDRKNQQLQTIILQLNDMQSSNASLTKSNKVYCDAINKVKVQLSKSNVIPTDFEIDYIEPPPPLLSNTGKKYGINEIKSDKPTSVISSSKENERKASDQKSSNYENKQVKTPKMQSISPISYKNARLTQGIESKGPSKEVQQISSHDSQSREKGSGRFDEDNPTTILLNPELDIGTGKHQKGIESVPETLRFRFDQDDTVMKMFTTNAHNSQNTKGDLVGKPSQFQQSSNQDYSNPAAIYSSLIQFSPYQNHPMEGVPAYNSTGGIFQYALPRNKKTLVFRASHIRRHFRAYSVCNECLYDKFTQTSENNEPQHADSNILISIPQFVKPSV